MKLPRQYPYAPITEAIIDLRTRLAMETDHPRLKQMGDSEKSNYPGQEELFEVISQLEVGSTLGSASMRQTPVGWKFTSEDQKQIFQSRTTGFTFSRLAPYDRWEPFRDEARRLWNVYRTSLKPETVERLAVRYINRINIPGTEVDLTNYFRTSPEIAPELPQQLEGFFLQLRLPFPMISGHCLVNQTIVPSTQENVLSVVLDIDLFRATDVPQSEEEIWRFFELLHETKNDIFEACITDQTRRLFESCPS